MSETYDPRARSFIKAPQINTCVTCGQPIQQAVKPMRNVMNRYINDISGNAVVLNDDAEYVTLQGVKLRREGVPKEGLDVQTNKDILPKSTILVQNNLTEDTTEKHLSLKK